MIDFYQIGLKVFDLIQQRPMIEWINHVEFTEFQGIMSFLFLHPPKSIVKAINLHLHQNKAKDWKFQQKCPSNNNKVLNCLFDQFNSTKSQSPSLYLGIDDFCNLKKYFILSNKVWFQWPDNHMLKFILLKHKIVKNIFSQFNHLFHTFFCKVKI